MATFSPENVQNLDTYVGPEPWGKDVDGMGVARTERSDRVARSGRCGRELRVDRHAPRSRRLIRADATEDELDATAGSCPGGVERPSSAHHGLPRDAMTPQCDPLVVEPQPSSRIAGDHPRDHRSGAADAPEDCQHEEFDAQFVTPRKSSDPKHGRGEHEGPDAHDEDPAWDLQVDRIESGRGVHTCSFGGNGDRLEH